MGDDGYEPPEDREFRSLVDQVTQLQEQVSDLQYQVLRLGDALVQSMTYSVNVAASLSLVEEATREQASKKAQETLQRIDEILDELPWPETGRPQLG